MKTEQKTAAWSTNGQFVWLTDDRAEINQRGDELSFEPFAHIDGYSHEDQARICRLIAASPELLSALEWLVEFFDKYPPHFSNGQSMSVDLDDLNEARAAIAKATGK